MDRNFHDRIPFRRLLLVRLVRACGSKPYDGYTIIVNTGVRLVRACGSKLFWYAPSRPLLLGQARKSLWIETPTLRYGQFAFTGQARKSLWIETQKEVREIKDFEVRLVRACGSKRKTIGQSKKTLLVRLVRACGSKLP